MLLSERFREVLAEENLTKKDLLERENHETLERILGKNINDRIRFKELIFLARELKRIPFILYRGLTGLYGWDKRPAIYLGEILEQQIRYAHTSKTAVATKAGIPENWFKAVIDAETQNLYPRRIAAALEFLNRLDCNLSITYFAKPPVKVYAPKEPDVSQELQAWLSIIRSKY